LVAVVTVLGFLLVTAAQSARADRRSAAPRKKQLIKLIETRRSQVGDLDAAVSELRRDVAAAARASRSDRGTSSGLLAAQAGTIAVRGRGVRVNLADSERPPRSPDDESAGRVHDVDVQLVVNSLFAAGAEAIAINGNRVVATTAIRAAGDTIVVNFRPLRPPYRVDAIGADLGEFTKSDIAERFKRWVDLFGLHFTATRRDKLTVPAFTGRVALTTAAPAGGGGE
jgi:uncharacterized protein YlxW (UPF0749 family)